MRVWRAVAAGTVTGALLVAPVVGDGAISGSFGIPAAAATTATAAVPPAIDSVACPTTLECVAVGGAGGVLVSRTSGRTWSAVDVPTKHFLYGVACSSVSHCVAVGDAGTALVTDNEGKTWKLGTTGVDVPLASVACPGAGRCFAVGDGETVIATPNGGSRWHRQSYAGVDSANGIACSSISQCAVVTSNAVENLVTVDGVRWGTASVPFSPLDALFPLNGIACAASTCVAVGSRGLLARSTDGGTQWSPGQSHTSENLEAASCPSATHCLAVGPAGTVIGTTDGGQTWQPDFPPTGETLLGVSCSNTDDCVAVGSGGTILTTSNGGANWVVRAGRAAPASHLRVLVVGDSFAHTLAMGLARDAPAYGVALIDGSTDGCSLARGSPALIGGHPYTVTGPCAATGSGWEGQYQADVAVDHPALTMLVLGPWDLTTRFIAGQWLTPGQPAYNAYYRAQVESAIRILTADGGRVAITTVPDIRSSGPKYCVPLPATIKDCPNDLERVAALNAAARHAAAEFPGQAQVIDLSHRLSPDGTYTSTVDGVVARSVDGVHMTESGDEWLTPWLLPRLKAAAR